MEILLIPFILILLAFVAGAFIEAEIGVFLAIIATIVFLLMSNSLYSAHNQASYLNRTYNLKVTMRDLFYSEELVLSDLRSKGIITDHNQGLDLKVKQND